MRGVDRTLAEMGGARHGVVTRTELLSAGVSSRQIERRVQRGSLVTVHRGVYRVGHAAPSLAATYLAAVLACGERALLCGLAAAHLHRVIKLPPSMPAVLCPTERRVRGVHTHRSRRPLTEEEVTSVFGIPVTSVARTLVDLARILPYAALKRACHEAWVLHKVTPAMVEPLAAGRPGAAKLCRAISGDARVTLSPLETAFLALLRSNSLPLPQTNRKTDGRFVDCRWPHHRLTVELDSYGFHNTRHAWEQDRRREREAYARGDQFRRYTWEDVTRQPAPVLRELSALLS